MKMMINLASCSVCLLSISTALNAAHYQLDTGNAIYEKAIKEGSIENEDYGTIRKSDELLLVRILSAFDRHRPDPRFKNVTISVIAGDIFLTGSVENKQDQQLLNEKISKIQGINNIKDQTEISGIIGALEKENPSNLKVNWPSANEEDRQLTARAQNALCGGALCKGYDSVVVYVRNGKATIDGHADSDSDIADIVKRIGDIDGIIEIDNRLLADGNISQTDNQLTLRSREALKGSALSKGYEDIVVDVSNGQATIKGYVDSENDRLDVVRRIKEIDGIKGVDDKLVLRVKASPSRI